MRDLYMKSGQGFILVFSITSSSSMNEIEMLREEITRIKDDDNVPIVIVGNKADLEEQRSVPRQRAFACSQMWDAPYYETSARTRSKSIVTCLDKMLLISVISQRRCRIYRHLSPASHEGREVPKPSRARR